MRRAHQSAYLSQQDSDYVYGQREYLGGTQQDMREVILIFILFLMSTDLYQQMNEGLQQTSSAVYGMNYDLPISSSYLRSPYPRVPEPELCLSDIMHVEGDMVMRKGDLTPSSTQEINDKDEEKKDDHDEPPSFADVYQSTQKPGSEPLDSAEDELKGDEPAAVKKANSLGTVVPDSETSKMGQLDTVEEEYEPAPSFDDVITSIQAGSARVDRKSAEMDKDGTLSFADVQTSTQAPDPTSFGDIPTSVQAEVGSAPLGNSTPPPIHESELTQNGTTSADNADKSSLLVEAPSFESVIQSTQASKAVDEPFERERRGRIASPKGTVQESSNALSFNGVVTSTQQPAALPSLSLSPESKDKSAVVEILAPSSQPSPPSTPSPVDRKRKRAVADEGPPSSPSGPSTPKRATRATTSSNIPSSSTLTPPATPTAIDTTPTNKILRKGSQAKDVYRTPTSAKRYTNLADLVKPISLNKPTTLSALNKASPKNPRSPSTPSGSGRRLSKLTPTMGDSPFSTPPSVIRRALVAEESPPSMRKPRMMAMAGNGALQPQSSGLFGLDYNSQYQIEENIDEVANFLKEDVWDADDVMSP